MKKAANLFILCILSCFLSVSLHAAQTLTLDPTHTYIIWRINHLGFSTQAGKWFATGTLVLDQEHPEKSKVNAVFKIAEMITGLPELDEHLKEKLFFDVERYPTASFVSNQVKMTGKETAKVYGTLILRGVSKPLVLDVKLNKIGSNPVTEKMTVGFGGTTKLKRSDFGMTAFAPALGDDVEIDIQAEAYKAAK